MEETQKFKEGLLNLANNLDSSNGVILITGINSGTSEKIDVNYHELIPQLALPALLSTVSSVYESVLKLYERGLERGDFSEEEVKKWNSIIDNMFNEFNSIKNDLAEKSFVKRTQIIKELEKEN
jgi:hypothetical protein